MKNHEKNLVSVGDKMRFVPHWNVSIHDDAKAKREKEVFAEVVMINKHGVFWCEYYAHGVKFLESFQLQDIGNTVRRVKG